MSGIEVAGIVLAVLGALIKGVDLYDEVVAGCDVKFLVRSLQVQKTMFSNSVEHLLRSVVPADELERLLDDERGEPWGRYDLDRRVSEHLGHGAEDITEKIHDIFKTVHKLQQKLPVCGRFCAYE